MNNFYSHTIIIYFNQINKTNNFYIIRQEEIKFIKSVKNRINKMSWYLFNNSP